MDIPVRGKEKRKECKHILSQATNVYDKKKELYRKLLSLQLYFDETRRTLMTHHRHDRKVMERWLCCLAQP